VAEFDETGSEGESEDCALANKENNESKMETKIKRE